MDQGRQKQNSEALCVLRKKSERKARDPQLKGRRDAKVPRISTEKGMMAHIQLHGKENNGRLAEQIRAWKVALSYP